MDALFSGKLPSIYSLLRTGTERGMAIEVLAQPDAHTVRCIALNPTEGLSRELFKACAESLAAENASRLQAMERAKKNIDEVLEDLNRTFHRLRQGSIDEELFDEVAGFEAL